MEYTCSDRPERAWSLVINILSSNTSNAQEKLKEAKVTEMTNDKNRAFKKNCNSSKKCQTTTFKTNKEGCRLLFNKMILDKEFTAKEIIDATLYDVNLKKERSYKTGQNQLMFLQNSHTYLLKKFFDGFVGMGVKKEPKTIIKNYYYAAKEEPPPPTYLHKKCFRIYKE
jgi:hypothetical protein